VREGPAFDPLKAQPDIQIIRSAYPLALLFPPGDQWRYSNTGYFTENSFHFTGAMPLHLTIWRPAEVWHHLGALRILR
jgi:hypothetical protein